MNIELYDCPHCNTSGVLPTSDNRCPGCRHPLTEDNKCESSVAGCGARAPITSRYASGKERHGKSAPRSLCAGMTIVGVVGLFLSPVVLIGTALAGGERSGTHWHIPRNAVDRAIEWATACWLVSWPIFEVGFAMSRARLIIQILVRIPIYGIIALMLLVLAIDKLLNNCTFFP